MWYVFEFNFQIFIVLLWAFQDSFFLDSFVGLSRQFFSRLLGVMRYKCISLCVPCVSVIYGLYKWCIPDYLSEHFWLFICIHVYLYIYLFRICKLQCLITFYLLSIDTLKYLSLSTSHLFIHFFIFVATSLVFSFYMIQVNLSLKMASFFNQSICLSKSRVFLSICFV